MPTSILFSSVPFCKLLVAQLYCNYTGKKKKKEWKIIDDDNNNKKNEANRWSPIKIAVLFFFFFLYLTSDKLMRQMRNKFSSFWSIFFSILLCFGVKLFLSLSIYLLLCLPHWLYYSTKTQKSIALSRRKRINVTLTTSKLSLIIFVV